MLIENQDERADSRFLIDLINNLENSAKSEKITFKVIKSIKRVTYLLDIKNPFRNYVKRKLFLRLALVYFPNSNTNLLEELN